MNLLTGFNLVRAAMTVEGISAPEQSVLTVLAVMADERAQCWPSIVDIMRRTKLSERAVQNATKALDGAGHVARHQRPGKGCVYTVHPRSIAELSDELDGRHHYIYRTTRVDTGEFYVGARSAHCSPEADSYVGSGRWIKEQIAAGVELRKEVVQRCPSRDGLAVAEEQHVERVVGDPLCRNAKRASPVVLTRRFTPAQDAPRTTCTPHHSTPAGGAPTPAPRAPKQPRTTITSTEASPPPRSQAARDPIDVPVLARLAAAHVAVAALLAGCEALRPRRGGSKRRWPADMPPPPGVTDDQWAGFVEHRIAKRARLTPRAYELLRGKLAEFAENGWPPGEAVDRAVERGWISVFPPNETRNASGPYRADRPSAWGGSHLPPGAEPFFLDEGAGAGTGRTGAAPRAGRGP